MPKSSSIKSNISGVNLTGGGGGASISSTGVGGGGSGAADGTSRGTKPKRNKLNSILNRTLSDSILDKKSHNYAIYSNNNNNSNTPHSRRDPCLSRKNSTNRRSIIHHANGTTVLGPNTNALLFPHHSSTNFLNKINTSNNGGGGGGAVTSLQPSSPSLLSAPSPNPLFLNSHQSSNILNYRNKLRHHRSSCCVLNNNVPGQLMQQLSAVNLDSAAQHHQHQHQHVHHHHHHNHQHHNNQHQNMTDFPSSFSSSLSSSLSPSPITISNHQHYLLSTPPSNSNFSIQNNYMTRSAVPTLSSPKFQLTPAASFTHRVLLPNASQNQSNLLLLASNKNIDTRRWSFASIHSTSSSGYGGGGGVGGTNTPPILTSLPASMQQPMSGNGKQVSCSSSTNILTDNMSNQSSLYSSNEKIAKSQSTQSQHSQSSCKLPGEHANTHQLIGGECKHEQNAHQHPHQIAQRLSLCERRSRMSSSNDSSQLDDSSEAGFSSPIPFNRQRARSLSCSPTKDQNESDIVLLQNERFKEIFPRACKQMEESLSKFIEANKIDLSVNDTSTTSGSGGGGAGAGAGGGGGGETDNPVNTDHRHHHQILKHQMSSTLHALDPAARFIHSQVLEIAKLCLEKSKSNQLTCSYFDETISSLEKLLLEACDKCSQVQQSLDYLQKFIKKFLLIVSRVARLLECIEFDPLEFCYMLEFAEQQAKQESISIDIPKYIISKLGFDRADPLEELHRQTDDGDYDELTAHDDDASNINMNNVKRNSDVGTASLAYKSSADSKALNTNTGALNGSSATGGGGQSSDDLVNTNNINSPIVKSEVNTPVVAPPCEDDFEEIKLISNGAYGAVYLVRHKLIGERFAMKKIKKHNLVLRNQLQQVFTERDIMTFTDNPFVVALVCTFETKKHLCMVMEYVEGGDVATLIKNMGPLPLDMARTYFAEATLAVEYLHNYGIIHRDLKPDNLLITSLGHIKLTDFGLSKIGLMNLTTNFYEGDSFMRDHYCKEFNDKQICGTPQYLAPEVILRQCYGKTVDWWSMGIILYEFLTSVAPFNGNTPEELFSNVINGELLWPDDNDELVHIPDDAKQLIIGLLAHEPLKRLGANGAAEIKQHLFFINLDWNNLLRTKAEFIPQLDGPDDTSYFDTRSERYNHDSDSSISVQSNTAHGTALGSSSFPVAHEPTGSKAESLLSLNQNDDTQSKLADLMKHNFNLNQTSSNNNNNDDLLINDETDNELFASFSSCSSRFRLNSISTNNSPVLFMNESNLNLSPSTHHLSDVKSSSNPTTGNKLSKTLFLPIDPIKLEPVVSPDVSVTKPVKANDDDNEPKTSPDEEEIKTNKVKDSQSSTCSSTSTNTTIDPNRTKTDLEPTADPSTTAPSTSLTKSSSCTVPVAVAKPATPTTPTTPSFNNSNNNGNVNKSAKSLQAKQQYHKPSGYGAQTGGNNNNGRRSSNKNSPTCDVPYYNGANNNSNQRARNYSINDYHIPSGGHHQGMQHQQHAYGGRNQAVNYGGGTAGTSKLNRWSSALASSTSAGSSAAAATSMSKAVTNNIEDYVAAHNHASLSKSNLNLTSNQTFEHPNNVYRKQTSMNEYENATGSVHSNQSPSSSRQNLLSIQNNNNTNQSNSKHHSNNQKKLHEIIQMGLSRPKVTIKRGYRGFGFTIGAIKVFTDDSDQYSIHHLVIQVDPDGAANSAGLKVNDIITHVNDEVVCGRAHHEIIRLIMSNNTLSLNTVQLSQTNIKKGQHRRTTAKSKFSKPSSTSSGLQKTPSHHHNPQHYHHYHHHYHHYNQHSHNNNNNPHNYHYSSHSNNNNNNNGNNHQSVNSANNGGVKNPGRQYKSFGGNNSNSNSNQSLSNYYFIKPSQNAQNELLFYNQMSNFLSSNPSTTHSSTSSLLSSASASSRQSIGPFVDYNQANQVYLAHHLHPPGSYSHMSQPFGPLVQQTSSSSSTSSQAATAPGVVQHMQPEKKKKTTLFRKLSEKRAHKYEFMQQQQQQQQQQFNYQQQQLQQLHQQQQLQAMQNNNPKHSSSSSSSSSSLNSSFNNNNNNNNNHNAHTGRLNSVGNLSPKLVTNYYQNFTNNSFTNATEAANNSANARRNMSTNDLRLFFTSSSEEATTNNNNNLATGSSQTSGNSNPNSDSSNSPSAPNSPACSKQQLTLNSNANVFSAALLNASTLTESANVANQSIKTGSLTNSNEPTTESAVKKPDDVQETDKNSNSNDDDGTNLDSTEHDNYNTITAASSSNTGGSSFFSGSKLIQNLFNSNHHFQSINHQSDSQSNESTPTNKSQAIVAPSFTNLTDSQTNQSKSANSKSGTQPPPPPQQQQQHQSTGSSQKSTKTSFISSIKSTIQQPLYNLSNRNNATKIASPFSAIKNNIITNNSNSKNHQQAANSTKQSKQTPVAVAVSQNPTPVINNDSELLVAATTDSSQIDSTTTNSTTCVDHNHHHQTDQKNETPSSSLANNDDESRTN